MKKKKLIIFLIIIIIFISLIGIIFFTKKDNVYTIDEKQWIENNKNKVIDISILSDIPIINYNGNGLLFAFLEDIEKDLGLKFNKAAYKLDSTIKNDFVFKLVDNKSDNELLILQDNYILISSNNKVYTDIKNINDLKIGVLSSDISKFNNIFNESVTLESFDSINDLYNGLISDDKVDAVIVLKTIAFDKLIKDNYIINYQFSNITKDYVISLNGNEILNSILKKYYNTWKDNNYTDTYNEYLLKHYFDFKNIKDSDRTNVKSKKYVYGFVNNGIFDLLHNSNLKGINNLILKNFSKLSEISISYKKFDNYQELINAYNNGNIDLFLNNTNTDNFNRDSLSTMNGINSKLLVISKYNNNILIDSLYALNNKDIAIIDSSKLENYFNNLNINYHKYKNLNDLLKHVSDNEFIIIDSDNYSYYKNSELMDYKINYFLENDVTYNYVISKDDVVFADLFNFYISYQNGNKMINDNYIDVSYKNINYLYILIILIMLILTSLALISINKIKKYLIERKKRKRINLSKEDKIKFIDQLTSLKNRAYLNSKIDEWDNSEVYPQSIVVVDLNNVSAINDNYGREEGDRVIVEAASILINSQLPNSEIIRTDGDEFLIYLVGYSEKNVISYLRGISREMKKLTHGFGAATGYSMINDGIKTIDDAVNEATLDMKNNKEDIDY